jgi:predicted  nucleic acid-binding Zn-ribbon protein
MSILDHYLLSADRSRRKGFGLPLITDQDEARQLATEIAQALSRLSDEERVLFLSNLGDLKEALKQRCEVLKQEIEQNRAELARITRTLFACNAYAIAASHARRNRAVDPTSNASCP